MPVSWFFVDIGNTLIKLAYERVVSRICASSKVSRDELLHVLEDAGGYRDLERGAVSFVDFYDFLCERTGYRGSLRELQKTWTDFFDGPVAGSEELLERLRTKYKLLFLSNSNEIHAAVIPKHFPTLFHEGDRFVFSHVMRSAKPDPEIFIRALELVAAQPHEAALLDDLVENVLAARSVGMSAFQFTDAIRTTRELEEAGLL